VRRDQLPAEPPRAASDDLTRLQAGPGLGPNHVAEFAATLPGSRSTGGSAGAHLAALLALTANNPAFQPGFETVDTSVLACVSMYGAYALGELFALTGWGRRFGAWMGRVVAGRTSAAMRRGGAATRRRHRSGAIHPGARAPFLVVFTGRATTWWPVVQARRLRAGAFREAAQPDTVVYVELPGAPARSFRSGMGWRSVRTAAGGSRASSGSSPGRCPRPPANDPGTRVAATGPTTTARTARPS